MKLKGFILGLCIGLIVAAVGVQLIGYTAAIAMPQFMAHFMAANGGAIEWYLALWNLIVVQLPGLGIVSALATYLSIRYLPWNNHWKGIGIACGAIGLIYALTPTLFKTAFIGHHLYEITVLLAVLPLSYFLSRQQSV